MPDAGIADGSTVTSSFIDTYWRQQVVTTCTSATRPSAVEGRCIFETDTDLMLIYTGSAWREVSEVGTMRSWTPTITQSVNVTFTNTRSRYLRHGNMVTAWFYLDVTGAGTGGNVIQIGGLPVTAASANTIAGAGRITDTGTNSYAVEFEGNSTTSFLALTGTNNNYVGAAPSFALANTDLIRGFVTYEV